ncbi:MAG: transposase, partial [Gammaproteobacteria bacterium]
KIYAIRWEIETLFSCLKSKGFNFEDTHITHRVRIKKLIAILAMGFCWAHLTGEWRHQHEKTIRIKKHRRPSMSLFRYGLDWIMNALFHRGQKLRRLVTIFDHVISKPLVLYGHKGAT